MSNMTSRHNARRRLLNLAQLELRRNEIFVPYAYDVALCGCETEVLITTIPCIPVARGMFVGGLYDRCLLCGKVWTARDYIGTRSKFIADPKRSICPPRGNPDSIGTTIYALAVLGRTQDEIMVELGVGQREVTKVLHDFGVRGSKYRRKAAA